MHLPPLSTLARWTVLLFAALYAMQALSPLRLNTDSARFLSMAVSAVEGQGFLVDGQPDPFPEGYPLLLTVLIRSGLNSTLWINAFNLLCVLGSILFFRRILALTPGVDPPIRTLLCLLPLASWVWIKHAAMPLSENAYLLLSMGALLLASRAILLPARSAWLWWFGAMLAAGAAFRVRTVGVTLIAALLIVALARPALWCLATKQRRTIAILTALLALIGGAVLVWRWSQAAPASTSYLAHARIVGDGGWLSYFAVSLSSHLRELGEIFLNLPATRFPLFTPLFWIAGALTLAAFLAGLPRLVRQFPVLGVYAGCYAALILAWPFYDPRFWMPLLPVMLLSAWLAIEKLCVHTTARGVVTAWAAVFLLLGTAAQLLSVRMSLAGSHFPMLYGDGTTRDTYRVAFGQLPESEAAAIDERVLRHLQRFEPRARATVTPP